MCHLNITIIIEFFFTSLRLYLFLDCNVISKLRSFYWLSSQGQGKEKKSKSRKFSYFSILLQFHIFLFMKSKSRKLIIW